MCLSFPGLLRSSRLIVARYGAGAAHRKYSGQRQHCEDTPYLGDGRTWRYGREEPRTSSQSDPRTILEEHLAPSLSGARRTVAARPLRLVSTGTATHSRSTQIDEHRRTSCAVPIEYEWESTRRVQATRFSTEPNHLRVSSLRGDRVYRLSSSF